MMPVNDATLEIFFKKFAAPERKEKYHIFKIVKDRSPLSRTGNGLVPGISIYVAKKINKAEEAQLINDFYDEYACFFSESQKPFADVVCTAKYLSSYGGKYYQMRSVNRSKNHNSFGFSDYDIYLITEEDYNALLFEKNPQNKAIENSKLISSFSGENEEAAPIYRELLHRGLTDEVMKMILNR